MSAQLIDGKALALKGRQDLAVEIASARKLGKRAPGLAVILVGEDPASQTYVYHKREACAEVGIESFYHHLDAKVSEAQLTALISTLNADPLVDGILLQLPLPQHIDADALLEHILPAKDVDGFHPYNLGRLAQRRPLLRPCTPAGIMDLLDGLKVDYKKMHAVIVGASNIVGRPMALELLLAGATVTICHRFTTDLAVQVAQADILVSATGKPELIQGEWIKPGAIVIDVGFTRESDGSIKGDIQFEPAKNRAAWITPVPGGVGPMTIYSLLKNTVTIWKAQS